MIHYGKAMVLWGKINYDPISKNIELWFTIEKSYGTMEKNYDTIVNLSKLWYICFCFGIITQILLLWNRNLFKIVLQEKPPLGWQMHLLLLNEIKELLMK